MRLHERVAAGLPLGGVCGHSVAVLERGSPVWRSPREEGCVELNEAVVKPDRESAAVKIEGFADAAFPVADVEVTAVGLDDDSIADGEGAGGGDDLVWPEASGNAHIGCTATPAHRPPLRNSAVPSE